MKIKIKKNVIHSGKIMKENEVHEVDSPVAAALIKTEFAVEHKDEPAKTGTDKDTKK